MTELDVTGSSAVPAPVHRADLGDRGRRCPTRDEPASLEVALSRLQHPDRELREQAARGDHRGAAARAAHARVRVQHAARRQGDQGPPARLPALARLAQPRQRGQRRVGRGADRGRRRRATSWRGAGTGSRPRLLGLDRLAYWDRMAPVGDTDEHIPYDEAREIVLDCYSGFSPELGEAAAGFFDDGYIDGPPRPGKRGGAFCSYTVPSRHPYVMLNYTSRPYDVLTMAHELGHGVHAALARPQGIFQFTTPLTLAETASIFGETIVLERLLERAPDAAARLSLLAGLARRRGRRGVPPDRDEPLRARRPHGAARERRAAARALRRALARDPGATCSATPSSCTTTTALWWSYVPHFVDTPGYVYAYAYGHLLALSVYRRYEEEGEGFVPSYLELLRAGGSRPPEELGADRRRRPVRPRLLELRAST